MNACKDSVYLRGLWTGAPESRAAESSALDWKLMKSRQVAVQDRRSGGVGSVMKLKASNLTVRCQTNVKVKVLEWPVRSERFKAQGRSWETLRS